jgi:hypothetical protein
LPNGYNIQDYIIDVLEENGDKIKEFEFDQFDIENNFKTIKQETQEEDYGYKQNIQDTHQKIKEEEYIEENELKENDPLINDPLKKSEKEYFENYLFLTSFFKQFWVLSKRNMKNFFLNPFLLPLNLLVCVIVGLSIGNLLFNTRIFVSKYSIQPYRCSE